MYLMKLLGAAVRFLLSKFIIFAMMLFLLISSHTVGFVADLTGRAIAAATAGTVRAVTSPTTVANQSRQISSLRSQNDRLTQDLSRERRTTQALRTQNRTISATLNRVKGRVGRTATINVSSTFGEAIPFYGIAIIVGATTYELKSSCDTMNDLYDLQLAIDPATATPDDRDMVCGLQVPTKEEIWSAIKSSPGAVWDSTVQSAQDAGAWAASLERPDFSGVWNRMIGSISDWF